MWPERSYFLPEGEDNETGHYEDGSKDDEDAVAGVLPAGIV